MKNKNLIIDGNNLLFISIASTEYFHQNNPSVGRKVLGELDISSLYSFILYLSNLVKDNLPDEDEDLRVYVCWDKRLKSDHVDWRKEVYPNYKANRSDEDNPNREAFTKIVKSLEPIIKKILTSMGINSVYPYTSEADDIINYLRNNLEGRNVIFTADRDLFQCVDENTVVYNLHKKSRSYITLDNWDEVIGIPKEHYVKYKAIMGDISDNISGLYRYGEVKTLKLLEDWDNNKLNLTEEQMAEIEVGVKIIDLDYKPLTNTETRLVIKQLERPEKISTIEIMQLFNSYNLTDIQNRLMDNWRPYLTLK